ncbi:hypothetical protein DW228_15995 [Bacteroides fragilis]|uniref:Uncharacterized protein n=1 Tax=Bacteroides fragilis TaxID=817 RepID=A0A396BXT7_BACFG|nr:hypothetical protein DWW08_04995 [Bacteroides fragilis]RGV86139.1 hypothetical protein DWW00_12195 [Bacteroides fragilis]RHH08908.1 hypothetical protein DW228_15995 [Bacteroides fragilis]RHH69763.1 hypothetical protein DW198_06335 [Bacteroides fragilis]
MNVPNPFQVKKCFVYTVCFPFPILVEQSAHLEEIHKRHEVELKLKEAEMKRCDVRGCPNRIPPSDY